MNKTLFFIFLSVLAAPAVPEANKCQTVRHAPLETDRCSAGLPTINKDQCQTGISEGQLPFVVKSDIPGEKGSVAPFLFKKKGQENVSIVQSTNPSLPHPIALDQTPSKGDIENMVRYALSLLGGMNNFVSGCSLVVIKPNIVDMESSEVGIVTDVNVVRAVAVLVFEANPTAHIVIAEGAGGWCPSDTLKCYPGTPIGDGFALYGYRNMITDSVFTGKKIDIVDLNVDSSDTVFVDPPYYARESYAIPKTLLKASCIINVPVMKIHFTGMTACLKNNIGVLPGIIYGWPKAWGYPYPSNSGLKHSRDIKDEEIVDIASITSKKIKLNVVDAIMCREKHKGYSGLSKRRNMIVGGEDMVSTDNVCARLMGLNPDDIEHITLAGIKGFGISNTDSIKILGDSIAGAKTEFIKDLDPDGIFGQSNRIWIFSLPFSNTDIDYDNLGGETTVLPEPGKNNWTQPLYFFDDYINLETLTPDSNNTIYAHTYFYSPCAESAELWIGSNEDIKAFLNGTEVYRFKGERTHNLPNDIVPIVTQQGLNRLMVKAINTKGTFDFCLNICETDARADYHGNRVWGLKFYPDSTLTGVSEKISISPVYVNVMPNPSMREITFNIYNNRQASVQLKIFDLQGRRVKEKIWQNKDINQALRWNWNPDKSVPAGVYFYTVKIAGNDTKEIKGKIVLLK
ncbi:MAG: DUF362 domain-containing protein [bacterium]|nr:DUF362 domain-containing protein [bacterium]